MLSLLKILIESNEMGLLKIFPEIKTELFNQKASGKCRGYSTDMF